MGQKVNPVGFRVGVTQAARSMWFAPKGQYGSLLLQDKKLRALLNQELKNAGLVKAEIERSVNALKITIFVSRPGVVIGKGGSSLEALKKKIEALVADNKGEKTKIDIKVEEVKKPDLSAKLVAERIADQLVKRFPHRRAISQALEKATAAGAKGIKIQLAGRIGGAEISRTEKYFEGSIPTQTLRSNIDYFEMPIHTKSGYVGIKVWIYTGQLF
ncbi:MAG: 30S ribosomal protein S3 [bacterium]|nr:30S ribosomal protein S3 [bacterium]